MKKMFVIAAIAASLTACNDSATVETTVDPDSSKMTTPVTAPETPPPVAYTPVEGDVSYRNGKVMVWRNNTWTESKEDVTLDNGVVVRRNGEVRRDKDVVVLRDGEVVSRTGKFFDNAGNAIDDAWDATKKGVRKTGDAIEKGAKKVKEETKDVFDGKKKNDNQ